MKRILKMSIDYGGEHFMASPEQGFEAGFLACRELAQCVPIRIMKEFSGGLASPLANRMTDAIKTLGEDDAG